MDIRELTECVYTVPRHGNMRVPVRIYASERLLSCMRQDKSIQQAINVAGLPGIRKASLMMPDAHQGYGFSIGGVAAMDPQKGVVSPGGVGFDINCGVRIMRTGLLKTDLSDGKKEALINAIFTRVPVGVGRSSELRLTDAELDDILRTGSRWALGKGMAISSDIQRTESSGCMEDADPDTVSRKAKSRGARQLGTLGAGNHFIEIQTSQRIFDSETAEALHITQEGEILLMIHCGSRGLGHQVCSDYIRAIEDAFPDIVDSLPERDLVYAPIQSKIGQDYYKAMCCAMNFAWCNRQIITHQVRLALKDVFPEAEPELIYDVSHNNVKPEHHILDGSDSLVWIHRKGATRAFPPGHPDLCQEYQKTGQPVIIPGSMGTASYILVGTQKAMDETFGTICHGAGRVMSRKKASQTFVADQVVEDLQQKGVLIKAGSMKGIVDESPGVYKDIDEVIDVCQKSGIARPIVRLLPLGVIKG
ncbi:MAG: RtcB family protein [Nanoarchaeota archaeon]